MAVKYLRLFDPTQQFQLKGGQLNVAGRLYVHLESTDDLAALYDENGSQLSQPVILDNNGRAAGLFVNAAQTYWLDVQDQYGMSQFTIRKMTPCGGGGGSLLGNTYDVVSSDGSIDIDKFDNAGVTTFDIGIAPNDSDEFLEWVKCSDEDISNGVLYPTFVDGTMEVYAANGLHVGKDKFYHITCTIKVDPTGSGINYETLSANLKFSDGDDHDLVRRNYDIDNSVNDPCLCEFSYDFKAPADGYLYLLIEGVNTFEQVDCELQVHRIYSGINAVPDTCATKQWVEQTFDYNLSSKVDYSAIEYNQYNEITGISGSAIAGGLDSATVSSIASSYAESAVSSISSWSGYFSSISSKVDQSAFDDCCSAVHSALDEKLDKSASGQFAPSGDYAYNSSLSSYIPTSASGMFQPSGDYQSAGDYAFNSSVSSKLDASASGDFVLNSSFSSYSSNVGDTINNMSSSITSIENNITSISSVVSGITEDWSSKADKSSLDDKLDKTASGMFQPSGDYAYNSSLSGYVDTSTYSSFSSEVTNNISSISSTVSGLTGQYIEQSASGMFQPSGNYVSADDMSAYVPFSGLEGDGSKITGISGSAIKGHEYTGIAPVNVDNTNDQISVDHRTLCVDSTMTAYNSGSSAVIGVNVAGLDLSSKMDASASSLFYPSSNPSGFITGVDLTPYQLTADMSGYYTTANESGYVDSTYVESQVSGKQDVSGMTAYQPAGDYQPSGDYIYVSALGWAEIGG